MYRMTLRRLHRVGEIDASIPMTLVGGHIGAGKPGCVSVQGRLRQAEKGKGSFHAVAADFTYLDSP